MSTIIQFKKSHLFKNSMILLVLFFTGVSSVNAKVIDQTKKFGYSARYGVVTPTQVYSILQNYQALFLYYVKNHKNKSLSKISTMKVLSASIKNPGHAFEKIIQLSHLVDDMSKGFQLSDMSKVQPENKKIIPAEVFLQSGHVLDAFERIMAKVEPDAVWGDFYKGNNGNQAKSPTDVFKLADLLVRNFKAIR